MSSRWLYFDTSVLVKLFFPEPGSDDVRQLWQEPEVAIVASPVAFLEVQSALSKKKVRGQLNESTWQAGVRHFEREMAVSLALGKVYLVVMDERLLNEAADAIRRASSEWGRILTALDSLHVASAVRLRELGIEFVSADQALCEIASRFGLPVRMVNAEGLQEAANSFS